MIMLLKKHKASKTIYLITRFPNGGFIAKKPTNINNTPRLDHTKKVGSIMYSSNIKDFEWFLRSCIMMFPFSKREKWTSWIYYCPSIQTEEVFETNLIFSEILNESIFNEILNVSIFNEILNKIIINKILLIIKY